MYLVIEIVSINLSGWIGFRKKGSRRALGTLRQQRQVVTAVSSSSRGSQPVTLFAGRTRNRLAALSQDHVLAGLKELLAHTHAALRIPLKNFIAFGQWRFRRFAHRYSVFPSPPDRWQ